MQEIWDFLGQHTWLAPIIAATIGLIATLIGRRRTVIIDDRRDPGTSTAEATPHVKGLVARKSDEVVSPSASASAATAAPAQPDGYVPAPPPAPVRGEVPSVPLKTPAPNSFGYAGSAATDALHELCNEISISGSNLFVECNSGKKSQIRRIPLTAVQNIRLEPSGGTIPFIMLLLAGTIMLQAHEDGDSDSMVGGLVLAAIFGPMFFKAIGKQYLGIKAKGHGYTKVLVSKREAKGIVRHIKARIP